MTAPRRTLTIDDVLCLRTLSDWHDIALAPDGGQVAFVLRDAGDPPGVWRLAVAALTGGDPRILNAPPLSLWGPSWSPSGDCLACLGREEDSGTSGPIRVHLWRPGEDRPRPLPPSVGLAWSSQPSATPPPRWTADGRSLLVPIVAIEEGKSPASPPAPAPRVWVFESPAPQSPPAAAGSRRRLRGCIAEIAVDTGQLSVLVEDVAARELYPAPAGRAFLWMGLPGVLREGGDPRQTLHHWDPDSGDQALAALDGGRRPCWSPDGAAFAVNDAGVVLLWDAAHVADGPRTLSPGERAPDEPAANGALLWTADGAALVVRREAWVWRYPTNGDTAQSARRPLNRVLHRAATRHLPPGPPIVFTRDAGNARHGLARLGGESIMEAELRMTGHPSDVTADGSVFVYAAGDEADPGDLWVARDGGRDRRRLTRLNPHLDEVRLGHRRRFPFRTGRGVDADATILLPDDWTPGAPLPTIVSVYPGSSPSLRIHDFAGGGIVEHQLLASRGYAVLSPDIPQDPDGWKDPEVTADAVLPAVNEAIRLGYADPGRLAIAGLSYGGYAVLTTVIRTRRFAAAIAASGAADFIPPYGVLLGADETGRLAARQPWTGGPQAPAVGVPPWEQPLRYAENSPVFFLDRIHTPLLLIAGTDDRRVAWLQSGEVLVGMRRLGRDCTLLLYPGEGHQPTRYRPVNRRDVAERVLAFLDTHLATVPANGGTPA